MDSHSISAAGRNLVLKLRSRHKATSDRTSPAKTTYTCRDRLVETEEKANGDMRRKKSLCSREILLPNTR